MANSSPSPARAGTKDKTDVGRTSAKAQPSGPSASRAPTHEQIAARAFEIYERDGFREERELEYWLRAETELGSSTH